MNELEREVARLWAHHDGDPEEFAKTLWKYVELASREAEAWRALACPDDIERPERPFREREANRA